MECNHPDALRRTGTDGKCHCGICWVVIEPQKEEKEKPAPKKRARKE